MKVFSDKKKETSFTMKEWVKINRLKILLIFILYQISILSIGIVNYPYIDDTLRSISGNAWFGEHYSRWGAEYASWLVQGSKHLTDMGLTTHILTGCILTVSSIILVYSLTKKLEFMTAIASTMLGINPWFLQCISFRFDSPYMALSILFSLLPFIYWNRTPYKFWGLSTISLFMMFNTYQSSSGIYILMLLALSYIGLVKGSRLKDTLYKIIYSLFAFLCALLLYIVETTLNPALSDRGDTTSIAHFSELIGTISRNCLSYFDSILNRSTNVWIVLTAIILILFSISSILVSKLPLIKSVLLTILYLILSSISSFGVYLAFSADLASREVRYSYGFSIFIVIVIILLLNTTTYELIDKCSTVIVALLCYYILTFTFVYSATLYYQIESFKTQSTLLATNLQNIIDEQTNEVYTNKLFNSSPIVTNTNSNYPILNDLVSESESLYWPNQILFQTYTGMPLEFKMYDPALHSLSDDELKLDNFYYKIYKKENKLFVFRK